MADSIDRVFVHALNTVKKIPRTGSSRPPAADRLRLYGLYKQAMEGDVDGVMDRPGGHGERDEETRREQDKWDAWDAQKGTSRTESKRKYIEALIETMHKYASTTADARELVAELEFVWDQIKNNSPTSSNSSPPRRHSHNPQLARVQSANDGPMRVLSPMSQDDIQSERRLDHDDDDDAQTRDGSEFLTPEQDARKTREWRKRLEVAMVQMTAEMAALREQIATGREWKTRSRHTPSAWLGWLVIITLQHFLIDAILLGAILFWLRKRKDRRVEDLVREGLRIFREYMRRLLPSR